MVRQGDVTCAESVVTPRSREKSVWDQYNGGQVETRVWHSRGQCESADRVRRVVDIYNNTKGA